MVVDGLSNDEVRWAAERWCGEVNAGGGRGGGLRLVVPDVERVEPRPAPGRIRLRAVGGDRGGGPFELRVGPHALVPGAGDEPDLIRWSARRAPSGVERELVVDLGLNHLLARQGLPVVHSCSFELDGLAVLGLGDSFSGKTTVAVAAMRAGGRVVSDDVVLVVPGGRRYSALPVRSFGWLRGRTREIVPGELQGKLVSSNEEGVARWVLHRQDGGGRFADRMAPGVVWVQSVDRRLGQSRVEPIDHGHVFAALVRATSPVYLSRHCPEIRDRLIPVFRELCEQCRGFRVRLSPRLMEEPEAEIGRLVEACRR